MYSSGSSHSVLTAHADPVHGLAWLNGSGDSEGLILSGCERGSIIAHDSRSRNPAWTLNLNLNSVLAEGGGAGVCCFSSATATSDSSYAESCDSLVVAGCTSGFICVINATRRSIAAVHKPHTDDVRSVAILDSARIRPGSTSLHIATTSFDGLGALWSYNPHQTSFHLETMLRGHTDKILGVCCGIRNSAVEILTTGADGKAILWTEQKAAQNR